MDGYGGDEDMEDDDHLEIDMNVSLNTSIDEKLRDEQSSNEDNASNKKQKRSTDDPFSFVEGGNILLDE